MEVRLNPLAAFVLSLVWPGWGQLYNGELRKAAVFVLSFVLSAVAVLFMAWKLGPWGALGGSALNPLIRFLSAVEAARYAAHRRFTTTRPRRLTALTLLALGVVFSAATYGLLLATIEAWPVHSYHIQSGSSIPTLLVNDYIVVDRWTVPQLNDLVVFQPPDSYEGDKPDLVKRIVGMAGDKIQVKDGSLWRNGQQVEEPWVHEPIDGDVPEHTVAAGHFYTMGDNRNNSADSRVFGDVPSENFRGRVLYVCWPAGRITELATPSPASPPPR